MTRAKVTCVARFPPYTFLENIIVRHDGSILVTSVVPKNLYYVPPPGSGQSTPSIVHTFEESVMGIVELGHDIFYVSTTSREPGAPSKLWKLDMRSFDPASPPEPITFLTFPPNARVLNGSAVLSDTVILCADSWADLIWRVDVPQDGSEPSARVWLKHEMFAHSEDPAKHDVPGVNGLEYDPNTHFVYFTTTAQTIFGRVAVDHQTLEAVGEPEDVTDRWMWADDLIVDPEAGVGYVTTHRQNTIERISLNDGLRTNMAGEPFDLEMIGPTAGSWGRAPGDSGRVAYFSTDGGIKNPFEGVVRESKILRVEFPQPQPQIHSSVLPSVL